MKIRKANKKDYLEAINIAKSLPQWFDKMGIKNMKTDFDLNNLIVAVEKNKVVGFLCYTTYCGKMLLMWMGVKDKFQRLGIGQKLLHWLEEESKKYGMISIEVKTLPDEDDYEPYKRTRSFYYKNGFNKILYKKATIKGWDDQIVMEKRLK